MSDPHLPGHLPCEIPASNDASQCEAQSGTAAAPPAAPVSNATLPVWRWAVEGLRAGFFLRARVGEATPGPWQLLALAAVSSGLEVGAARWQVPGPAQFQPVAWLGPWWVCLALLWCAWCALPRSAPPRRLAAWFALSLWGPLLAVLLAYGVLAWGDHHAEAAAAWQEPLGWLSLALTVWSLAAIVWVGMPFFRSRLRTAGFSVTLVALFGAGLWTSDGAMWVEDPAVQADGTARESELLHLSQEVFEAQQALWQRQVQSLAAQREGVVDVYGLVFAPFASENVFRRESTLVRELLEQRFDAQGRVIQLLNHAETAATHVWATPQNLRRAVAALGARMDREHDVLVVYLTSHGGQDHQLAASHWPLEVPSISPEMLREVLDDAGIRHRVIAVSACYSGGWIEPLASDSTLVMTAADATHTSYGCGHRSELTFFGRAVFDEQLRATHSFAQAFEKAVPVIRQREIEGGKQDGFSNPQIRVGSEIAPVLHALAHRLDTAGAD